MSEIFNTTPGLGEKCLVGDHKMFLKYKESISILWIILGTIGNLLSFFVFVRRKMRVHSAFTYLMLLSMCDTLVIYIGLLRDYLVYVHDVNINNDFFCKIHVFSFYFLLHMASWLLVAVNIDRFIATSFLHFSKSWCTPRRAFSITILLVFVLVFIDGHLLVYVESLQYLNQTKNESATAINPFVYKMCIINKNKFKLYNDFFQNIFPWIDTSTQVIIPFIIMIICNCNIIYKVLLANKKTNSKNIKRLRKIRGMCIMILTVSVLFIILELPVLIVICLIQGGWIKEESKCNEFLFIVTSLMMYTNHIINFVSYAMTGTQFRRELLLMLYFKKLTNFFTFKKPFSFKKPAEEPATENREKNDITLVNLKNHLNGIKPNTRHLIMKSIEDGESRRKGSIQQSFSLILQKQPDNLLKNEEEFKISHKKFRLPIKCNSPPKKSERSVESNLSLKLKKLKNDLNDRKIIERI